MSPIKLRFARSPWMLAGLTLGAGFCGRMSAAQASEGDTYAIEQHAPQAVAGMPAKVSLAVVGKKGWHINAEAPITVSLAPDATVTFVKSKLTRADLAESTQEKARFDIGFTAASAGSKKISADARFVMCQEQACKPVRETVTLEVAVVDAKPVGAATTPSSEVGGPHHPQNAGSRGKPRKPSTTND